MKINKRAAIGEGMMMLVRLAIVAFLALVIFGVGMIAYGYNIDVRTIEAGIINRNIASCLMNFDYSSVQYQNKLLEYCGYKASDRIYVRADIKSQLGDKTLEQGDSGAMWIKQLFAQNANTDKIAEYEPGYYSRDYSISLNNNGEKVKASVNIEVLLNA